jgi:hypothetical protein
MYPSDLSRDSSYLHKSDGQNRSCTMLNHYKPLTLPIYFDISILLYTYNSYKTVTIRRGGSRDRAVGIATGCGPDNRGIGARVPVGSRILSTSSRPALGSTQPSIQWEQMALPPGVKRPGREADHSPPARAEVRKTWIYTSTPPYAFTDNFTI